MFWKGCYQMKEASDILIKLKRTGDLFLADELTRALVDVDPADEAFDVVEFSEGTLRARWGGERFPVTTFALKYVEGQPKKSLHVLFGSGQPRISIGAHPDRGFYFEPVEVLGRVCRELVVTEDHQKRKLEATLTATLQGVDPARAGYIPAPVCLLLTDQGGCIAIHHRGLDGVTGEEELFDDLEDAIATLMIYPEEVDVVRIAPNPARRCSDPWFGWALRHIAKAPVELRPFLKKPERGCFSIPRDVADKAVAFAQEGPDFSHPTKGPAFIFLSVP